MKKNNEFNLVAPLFIIVLFVLVIPAMFISKNLQVDFITSVKFFSLSIFVLILWIASTFGVLYLNTQSYSRNRFNFVIFSFFVSLAMWYLIFKKTVLDYYINNSHPFMSNDIWYNHWYVTFGFFMLIIGIGFALEYLYQKNSYN